MCDGKIYNKESDMLKLTNCFAVMALMLVSCGDSEPAKDVAYYLKHSDERQQKRELCRKQQEAKMAQYVKEGKKDVLPTDIEPSANCKNAEDAEKQHRMSQKSDEMPSLVVSVDYYLTHDEERKEQIEACKSGGMLAYSSSCKNAKEAERQHKIKTAEKDSDNKSSKKNSLSVQDDLDHFLKDDAARREAIDQCERNSIVLKGIDYCKNAQKAEKIKQDASKK